VYGGLLRVLWQAGKHQDIVAVCRQGLARAEATNRVLFHRDLARALILLGKPDEAITEASAAVEVAAEAQRLPCRCARANILAQAGKFDQAVAECLDLLRETTDREDVRTIRHTLHVVHVLAKDNARAEEELRKILDDDPNDATANNDLGYLWADQGKNLQEAERLIRKAIELDRAQRSSGTAVSADSDRDNAAYIDSLGWVLFRLGQLPAARKELEKAANLPDGPDDPVVWDHLGDACFRLRDRPAALAAWKKAVELYETLKRRRLDDRCQEIKQKLRLLEAQGQK
jgi:tetratricopeptide (TPR) repeat protein